MLAPSSGVGDTPAPGLGGLQQDQTYSFSVYNTKALLRRLQCLFQSEADDAEGARTGQSSPSDGARAHWWRFTEKTLCVHSGQRVFQRHAFEHACLQAGAVSRVRRSRRLFCTSCCRPCAVLGAQLGQTPLASLTLPPRYALLTDSSLSHTGLTVLGEIASETSTVELALGTAHGFVSEERLQHLVTFLHKHLFLRRRSAVKAAELIDSKTLE